MKEIEYACKNCEIWRTVFGERRVLSASSASASDVPQDSVCVTDLGCEGGKHPPDLVAELDPDLDSSYSVHSFAHLGLVYRVGNETPVNWVRRELCLQFSFWFSVEDER